MKKIFFLFILAVTFHSIVLAQCNSGSVILSNNTTITGSCKITGDLTLLNGGVLNVDLTSAAADTFVVRGNIVLKGNAVLWIHAAPGSTGDQFIVSNAYSNQRTITTQDSSKIKLEYVEFRTQEGSLTNAASIYMNYNAQDRSTLYCNKSWLNPQTAWMLCNMKNKSTLIGYEPNHVPTETYLQDTAQIVLHGPNTNTGLWLNFDSITDTLDLPNSTQISTWKIGRGNGGLAAPWYLEADTARVGIGVQILPTSKLTINGTGLPATGELKVSLLFSNNTETIKNLKVGIQNTTVANGINGYVTLHNVNLGPIAWQLYALINENLTVKNSIVNEIGIAGPSKITVDSSLLQFAVLDAGGIGGSTLTINNSAIWNQSVTAGNDGTIILNNCNVTGSVFSTTDAQSHITVNGGCFFSNSSGCTETTMVNITNGQPNCNPFIPPGFPQNLSPAQITFNHVNNTCITEINKTANVEEITIFPNPSNNLIHVSISDPGQNYSIEVYSILGQQLLKTSDDTVVDISNFSNGTYMIMVKQDGKIWINRIVKQQ